MNTTDPDILEVGLGPPRFRVRDTIVHSANRATVADLLGRYLDEGKPRQIVTVNLDFLRIARTQPAFNDLINGSDLTVLDGAPLVWMARYLGLKGCERVTGPDLIEAAAELSAARGHRLYFLGAAPGIADQAKLALEGRIPSVQICGTFSPPESAYPFPADLDAEICDRIRGARPDILFVGFGCPKQDFWIRDHLEELQVPVSVGIGGSFNFLCGLVPRAPRPMQRWGLEWVYRLYSEPRRLWRRYIVDDLPFALGLMGHELQRRVGLRRTPALSIEP